jgi:hypothetical protein
MSTFLLSTGLCLLVFIASVTCLPCIAWASLEPNTQLPLSPIKATVQSAQTNGGDNLDASLMDPDTDVAQRHQTVSVQTIVANSTTAGVVAKRHRTMAPHVDKPLGLAKPARITGASLGNPAPANDTITFTIPNTLPNNTQADLGKLYSAIHEAEHTINADVRDEEELSAKNLAMLWQAAVERSATIRYAIEKIVSSRCFR